MPPYYEYSCPDCENKVLLRKRVAERDDTVRCDNKGAHPGKTRPKMKRPVVTNGFILKGDSWARDGYAG